MELEMSPTMSGRAASPESVGVKPSTTWNQRGRKTTAPKKAKAAYLEVRLEVAEKEAFQQAADLAGLALSAWVRERLRQISRRELEEHGQPVPFLRGR